jgi:hypothetical protein
MSSGQSSLTTQLQLGSAIETQAQTVFSPPGIFVETAKYPVLMAGVLAATHPSEFLSIYDHPPAWRGLDIEAIFSMRRNLYRFLVPVDARSMTPHSVVETLQEIALSVGPVALGVECSTLPPRRLQVQGGMLPTSSEVILKRLDVISETETSRVAERISQKDIPTSEAVRQLYDYEYSLEQIARLISVGLLGKHGSRRLVPLKAAYKVAIDAIIDSALLDLADRPVTDSIRIHTCNLHGDSFTVLARPGDARVDYFRATVPAVGKERGYSFDDVKSVSTDPKSSVYADHARFSAYTDLLRRNEASHIVVLHLAGSAKSSMLGPWLARAGVEEALSTQPVIVDSIANAGAILEALYPNLHAWSKGNALLERLGLDEQESHSVSVV